MSEEWGNERGWEQGDETKGEIANSKYDNWVVGYEGGI